MQNANNIKIPSEITEYLWTRYLPETTYKLYALIGYLNENGIKGEEAKKTLLDSQIEVENNITKIIDEKKEILSKLGLKYPESRQEDLELLLKFKLIKKSKDEDGEIVYKYVESIERPQDILNIDDEELKTLENIKFEIQHENGLNMILTLILNNNGKLTCSIDHIIKTTRVKLTEVKEILDYLVNVEGSVNIIGDKPLPKLKKQDKIYINLNEQIFNEKRFIV